MTNWKKIARGEIDNAARIARGEAGTCIGCLLVFGVRVPKGGDGTLRVMRYHTLQTTTGRRPCSGCGEPALEWGGR